MTNRFLNSIYQLSPYSIQNIFVNLRGMQLKNIRYGGKFDELVKEAEEREYWTNNQWKDWQISQLEVLLNAARNTPYYMEKSHRVGEYSLKDYPILDKQTLKNYNKDFILHSANKKMMFQDHTSGSTGTPLSIWFKKESIQNWYALVERRWRNWYGVSRKDKWAIFGGQLIVNQKKISPPYWIKNKPLNQLYFSVFHMFPGSMQDYITALNKFKPKYIYGYASALFMLAFEAKKQNLNLPQVEVVLNNAEPLYHHQRVLISDAFQAPCRDTYGMAETVAAGSECEYGTLHAWPETGVWEILDSKDSPVGNREVGRLISTGLLNKEMPMLRYDSGDLISIDTDYSCKCGRTLPAIIKVEGRNDDCIITSDGRKIGRIDSVFKSDLNIIEAQIIQISKNCLKIKIVPDKGYGAADNQKIKRELENRIGEMEITFEIISNIPRQKNGKFKAVVSQLREN